jgi:hypothetical protein
VFDFISIGVIWFASLWGASRLMEVPLFRLISVSALQFLGFYLILLVVYFFFFFLLLGVTLGDLIFAQEE